MQGPPWRASDDPRGSPDRRSGDDPRGARSSGPPHHGAQGSRRRKRNRSPRQARAGGGSIGLARIAGHDFELLHPRGVQETEPDYEEGLEIWRAGDPEGARDALRYALAACHDNMWIHVALGRLALEAFSDPSLARGHFGYAFALAHRALPHHFSGRLPPERPSNRPFYEAIAGLLACLEQLGRRDEGNSLKMVRDRLASGGS
jgi:hypothetical protein